MHMERERGLIKTIQDFCAKERLRCISVLPDMVAAMRQGTAIYGTTMDGHPKAAGYRVIAESIFGSLLTIRVP